MTRQKSEKNDEKGDDAQTVDLRDPEATRQAFDLFYYDESEKEEPIGDANRVNDVPSYDVPRNEEQSESSDDESTATHPKVR